MSRFLPALVSALVLLAGGPAVAADLQAADLQAADLQAAVPQAGPERPRLLLAQPFSVATPWRHSWQADPAPVTEGVVLVLAVDPADALPRQVGGLVLYVGATPAERITWSAEARHLVVVVPGLVDLAETPVFWGPATLPERVTPAVGAAVLAEHGGPVAPPSERAAAEAAAGTAWAVQDRSGLDRRLAPLVRTWVPEDASRVQGWD